MPIGQKRHKNAYLIPDLMYAVWLMYGSLRSAATYLAQKGVVSSTGKAITANSISLAARKSPLHKAYLKSHEGEEFVDPTSAELEVAQNLIITLMPEQIKQARSPIEHWQKNL